VATSDYDPIRFTKYYRSYMCLLNDQ